MDKIAWSATALSFGESLFAEMNEAGFECRKARTAGRQDAHDLVGDVNQIRTGLSQSVANADEEKTDGSSKEFHLEKEL